MSKKRKNKTEKPQQKSSNVKRIKDQVRGVFAHHIGERFSF